VHEGVSEQSSKKEQVAAAWRKIHNYGLHNS
jgi:hypothetical protein